MVKRDGTIVLARSQPGSVADQVSACASQTGLLILAAGFFGGHGWWQVFGQQFAGLHHQFVVGVQKGGGYHLAFVGIAPAQTTGATQFLTFLGGMSGTAIFAGLVSLSGSYSAVFAGLALLPAITGVVLLAASRRKTALSSPAR